MKNQKQNQIRLSVEEAHQVLRRMRYERASCVAEVATCRRLQLDHTTWDREIAEADALIATIEAQL